MLQAIARVGRWGRVALTQLSLWSLCAIVVLMVVDVVGRKLFDHPLLGGVELVEQLLLVSVYAAIPLVSRARGHINIELFDTFVPARLQSWRHALGEAFCGVLMVACAWLVAHHAVDTHQNGDTTTLLRISLWPLEALVAVLLLMDGLSHFAAMREEPEGAVA